MYVIHSCDRDKSELCIAKQRNAERKGYSTRKSRIYSWRNIRTLFGNLTYRLITFDRNVEYNNLVTGAAAGHFTAIM